MKPCPRCDSLIGETAIACSCGWKDRKAKKQLAEPAERIIPCAHETCAVPAICRIKTHTGWAALCKTHYDEYFIENAKKTCERLGLDTLYKRRTWAKENVKKLHANLKPFYMQEREPGEDEDYQHIAR